MPGSELLVRQYKSISWQNGRKMNRLGSVFLIVLTQNQQVWLKIFYLLYMTIETFYFFFSNSGNYFPLVSCIFVFIYLPHFDILLTQLCHYPMVSAMGWKAFKYTLKGNQLLMCWLDIKMYLIYASNNCMSVCCDSPLSTIDILEVKEEILIDRQIH